MVDVCPLCDREYGDQMEDHHLKPVTFKSRTKEVHDPSNFVRIHKVCHSAIHAFFDEKELFNYYHTIPRLLETTEMKNFVKWISKKDPSFYIKMKRSNRRK